MPINPFKTLVVAGDIPAYTPTPVIIKEAFAIGRGDIPLFIKILWEAVIKYNITLEHSVLAMKRGDPYNWNLKHASWQGNIIFRVSNDAYGEQIRCIPNRRVGSELIYNTEFVHYICDKMVAHDSMVIRECIPVYNPHVLEECDSGMVKEMHLDMTDFKIK